jgi:hypothetical protein
MPWYTNRVVTLAGERTTYLAETTGQLGTSRGLDLISVWLGSCLLSWSDSYVCEMAEQDSVAERCGDSELHTQ